MEARNVEANKKLLQQLNNQMKKLRSEDKRYDELLKAGAEIRKEIKDYIKEDETLQEFYQRRNKNEIETKEYEMNNPRITRLKEEMLRTRRRILKLSLSDV